MLVVSVDGRFGSEDYVVVSASLCVPYRGNRSHPWHNFGTGCHQNNYSAFAYIQYMCDVCVYNPDPRMDTLPEHGLIRVSLLYPLCLS